MNKIITHLRPHLDDICALWLLKKYLPEAKDAELAFIPTNERGGDTVSDPGVVYVGVGRGQFDEHKGDIGQCATTLVFDFVKKQVPFPDALELQALEWLVEWVRLEDTGQLNKLQWRDFSVPTILEYDFNNHDRDSAAATELGFRILEAALAGQKNAVVREADWGKRIEFESIFGKAVGLETSARDIDSVAYFRGFDLVVYVNKEHTYHNIRAAADSGIDLTPVWLEIKQVDPEAGWYFHHSKKMLICGGDITAGVKTSKLTLEWLIDLLTPNYVRQQRY